MAHLLNQDICQSTLILQVLILLLEHPTSDSIEIACAIVKETGAYLLEHNKEDLRGILDALRRILQEGNIEQRTQYVIEQLFAINRNEYAVYDMKDYDKDKLTCENAINIKKLIITYYGI